MVIYRLITCGTVEEKIYRKQVFKKGLSIVSNGGEEAFRYFTKQELRDLFSASYEGFLRSETQKELEKMHACERESDADLDKHLAFLESLGDYFGISDHNLLFTKAPDEAAYHIPYRKVGGGGPGAGRHTNFSAKFSAGGGVPQSPLAKKMQARSQWDGAGMLSHLTLDDREDRAAASASGAGSGGAKPSHGCSTQTLARIGDLDINQVTANGEKSQAAVKEVQKLREGIARMDAMLSNKALVKNLPDKGEKLQVRCPFPLFPLPLSATFPFSIRDVIYPEEVQEKIPNDGKGADSLSFHACARGGWALMCSALLYSAAKARGDASQAG